MKYLKFKNKSTKNMQVFMQHSMLFIQILQQIVLKEVDLKKLCSLLNQEVISYCIGDSYNDLDMFEKADHAYTFNRVEKQIKEKTEKQVDYVYEVINDMLEGE